MPKEVKTYQCNYCRHSYDNVVLAEKCESSHIPIRDYMPLYERKESRYPDSFRLTFDDKSTIEYHKQNPSSQPPLD